MGNITSDSLQTDTLTRETRAKSIPHTDGTSVPPRLYVVALCLCLTAFLAIATPLAYQNVNSSDWDQRDYLRIALQISQGGAFTDGNRNPLYPLILAPFAQREIAFFSTAKLVSLGIGCLGLIAISAIARTYVGGVGALVITVLMLLNSQYTHSAAHVDVEILLTPLFMLAWHYCCALVAKLSGTDTGIAQAALMAGLLSALVYLAKGTGLLFPLILAAALTLRYGTSWLKHRAIWVYVITFCTIAAPLWIYNMGNYGNPLYNVNTTHYMWNDSWEANYVYDLSELPTAYSYTQTHQLSEVWERLSNGLRIAPMQWYGALRPSLDSGPTTIEFGIALALGIATLAAASAHAVKSWRDRSPWYLFTAVGVIGFLILFAWYHPISDASRFILPWVPVLYLALVYSVKLAVNSTIQHRHGLRHAATALCIVACAAVVVKNAQSLPDLADMSSHDRVSSRKATGIIKLLLSTTLPGDRIVIGPTHGLPYWLAFDRETLAIPHTRVNWAVFQSWLLENRAQAIIVDGETWTRRQQLLDDWFYWSDRGLAVRGTEPLGWSLAEPSTYPCTTCLFTLDYEAFSPAVDLEVTFGDAVQLSGYTLGTSGQQGPDSSLEITLFWSLQQPLSETTHVFVHLLDEDGVLVAQDDGVLIDDLRYSPDTDFRAGTYVRDTHRLPSPRAGTYYVTVGIYEWATQQRISITGPTNLLQQDHLALVELAVH